MWKLGHHKILSSNWFIQLSTLSSHFQAKIAHFQDAIWKKITPILFKCATCCYTSWMYHWKRESIKNTVVSRLHNSIAISWYFNAAGVISRKLNRLCKYCTVWRRWQYSWRRIFAQLTCWWPELGSIHFYQFQIPFQFLFINSWVNSNSFGVKKSQFQFLKSRAT